MTEKRFIILLSALHLIFYVLSLSIGGNKIADSWDYLYQAENIRTGGSFYAWTFDEPVKSDYFTKRTPAYGIFLMLLGSWIPLVLLVQNALSVWVWLLVYRFLKRNLLNGQKAAQLVLLALVFQSNTLVYANTIIAEIPFQLLLLLGSLRLFEDLNNPKRFNFLWVSLCFTGAVLFKPVLMYFWIPLLVYAVYQAMKRRRLRLIWPIAIMPLTILLWGLHNEQVTGWAHYTSINTVNLKDYNTRLMLEAKYGADHADSIIRSINDSSSLRTKYGARNRYIREECKKLIQENWPTYVGVHLKGMVAMLIDPGRFDYVQFFRVQEDGEAGLMYRMARGDFSGMWQIVRQQPPLISFFFFLNLAGSLALLLLVMRGLRHFRVRKVFFILCLGIVAYFWVLTGPVGTMRYKSGILPLLVVLAGVGLQRKR